MRNVILAVACATLPLNAAACVGFGQQAAELKPRSVRQALAEAEILFMGAVQTSGILYQAGYVSQERALELAAVWDRLASAINTAHAALKIGDALSAGKILDTVLPELHALALELSTKARAASAGPPPAPAPSEGI